MELSRIYELQELVESAGGELKHIQSLREKLSCEQKRIGDKSESIAVSLFSNITPCTEFLSPRKIDGKIGANVARAIIKELLEYEKSLAKALNEYRNELSKLNDKLRTAEMRKMDL